MRERIEGEADQSAEDTSNQEVQERLRAVTLEMPLVQRLQQESAPKLRPGAFAAQHGLQVKRTGDSLEFKLKVGGEDRTLLTAEASEQGLEEAGRKLNELIESKQKELTAKYKVEFAKQNEDADKQWIINEDCSLARGAMIKSRAPRLAELYGIEAALVHSQPSNLAENGQQGVKFYFLNDGYVKDESSDTVAYYINKDTAGRPAVLIAPTGTDGKLITEKDAETQPNGGEYTIEALLTHELAHNTQFTLGWNKSEVLEKVSEAMGWAPFEDEKTHETIWLIKGKNNFLYKLDQGCQGAGEYTGLWVRCDKAGQPVDKDGNVVRGQEGRVLLSMMEMRQEALIKPPTDYFDNAVEMAAESLMLFRLNERRRAFLLRESPELYRFIKTQDQLEIDHIHGKNAKGESIYLRQPNGTLAANNAENQKIVAQFETAAREAK